MEHHFEKRLPALLNFILICQDFNSPSTLRHYLEGKGCAVIHQDNTTVGIGATTSLGFSRISPTGCSPMEGLDANREVDIHAYMRTPGNWHTDFMQPAFAHGRGNGYAKPEEKADQDKEETLCVAFVKATAACTRRPQEGLQFYEEALAQVRSAYARHASRSTASRLSIQSEDVRTPKDSIYLTTREHEILKWVSEGKGCWETGAILGISERTVKFHLQNIYRKLNVVNRAQAITKAMRYALI